MASDCLRLIFSFTWPLAFTFMVRKLILPLVLKQVSGSFSGEHSAKMSESFLKVVEHLLASDVQSSSVLTKSLVRSVPRSSMIDEISNTISQLRSMSGSVAESLKILSLEITKSSSFLDPSITGKDTIFLILEWRIANRVGFFQKHLYNAVW